MATRRPLVLVNGQLKEITDEDSLSGQSPTFQYTSGVLTRIDYANGSYKLFTYSSEILVQVDFVKTTETVRKTLNYTGGILSSITETLI